MRYDLLIKGGHVIDAAAGLSGAMDVAVRRNRIAAVDRDIPVESAFQVIEANDQYVSPGLVDLHTHVYRGFGALGVDADSIAWRTGVTTWVDAGSVGGYTLPGFREYIVARARVRIPRVSQHIWHRSCRSGLRIGASRMVQYSALYADGQQQPRPGAWG